MEINVVIEDIKDAVMIPTEVVVPDIEGEKVFVYRNGKAVPQIVVAGVRTENEIRITSGLNVGDTLIVSGIIQLRPNSRVKLNTIN